ncbi:MAG: hypothetical protein ABJH68_12690 [Ilumatobacter sp.]|uniref:hypothetical protein n=1 Tax=Ilumatobacter sp. TaxID=1967498 RepID=UPI003296FA16
MKKFNTRRTRRLAGATVAVALAATGVIGASSFASGDDNTSDVPDAPPGEPFVPDESELPADDPSAIGSDELIQTSGTTFDETILTKYIPASGFDPYTDVAFNGDSINFDSGSCLTVDTASVGAVTRMWAPVELPDGARIKRVTFFGEDSSVADNITVRLLRQEFTSGLAIFPLPPTVSRTNTVVDLFSTSTSGGDVIVSGADGLGELTGSPSSGGLALSFPNRFHTIEVDLDNSADADHTLCGVRIEYQVAAPADAGTVFHPLDPVRAFDSRIASLPQSGRLGPNQTKVIDITDGYDSTGAAVPAQDNVVPTSATAVAYNITIAGADGPNFVAVTAGDAAAFTASAINYSAGSNVANGSSVTVAADQTIKLWGGDNTGSSHVIIDIVGYYSPPVPSNMGN